MALSLAVKSLEAICGSEFCSEKPGSHLWLICCAARYLKAMGGSVFCSTFEPSVAFPGFYKQLENFPLGMKELKNLTTSVCNLKKIYHFPQFPELDGLNEYLLYNS